MDDEFEEEEEVLEEEEELEDADGDEGDAEGEGDGGDEKASSSSASSSAAASSSARRRQSAAASVAAAAAASAEQQLMDAANAQAASNVVADALRQVAMGQLSGLAGLNPLMNPLMTAALLPGVGNAGALALLGAANTPRSAAAAAAVGSAYGPNSFSYAFPNAPGKSPRTAALSALNLVSASAAGLSMVSPSGRTPRSTPSVYASVPQVLGNGAPAASPSSSSSSSAASNPIRPKRRDPNGLAPMAPITPDRKSTRLNSSHT